MNIAHRCRAPRVATTLGLAFALATLVFQPLNVHASDLQYKPGLDPHHVDALSFPNEDRTGSATSSNQSAKEWTYHKTPDGAHPDAQEQQIIWLMNRARANPQAEADWLLSTPAPEVALARDFFKIDSILLEREMDAYKARPPAAFDVRLYRAALAHDLNLIARDSQDHDGQYDRVVEAGFKCQGGSGYFFRGNVFSFSENGLNTHAAWNIDWGGPEGGMQVDRGHRMGVMSVDGDLTNVGIAMVAENVKDTLVGPYVTTANYCHAAGAPDHYNRFLVGAVWEDKNSNQMYDPGEGIPGVKVSPQKGEYYAVTGHAGGYTVPITRPGRYQVTFSGPVSGFRTVEIGQTSALLDFVNRPQVGIALP
jgi:hypothetical protein